jgi:hypothetical protein
MIGVSTIIGGELQISLTVDHANGQPRVQASLALGDFQTKSSKGRSQVSTIEPFSTADLLKGSRIHRRTLPGSTPTILELTKPLPGFH